MALSRVSRWSLLLLPVALYAGMTLALRLLTGWLGREAGYLAGFGVYWLLFCLGSPLLLLGKAGFSTLLVDQSPLFTPRNWVAAVTWGVVVVAALAMYGGAFGSAPLPLILIAMPLATINGFCEEILWRGLFVRASAGNRFWAIFYPALAFALWHFVPQEIYPAGSPVGFVISTLFLGLAYGFIAYRTGSARWTAISHSLSGIVALADPLARFVLAWLAG